MHAFLKDTVLGKKEDRSWRCDVHPAWSYDGNHIVVNYFNVNRGTRQVALITLNWPAIHHYFETETK